MAKHVNARGKAQKSDWASRLTKHVRKYLILYTLLAVFIAVFVGYYTKSFASSHAQLFSNLVILFAIMTIYPSMIQLKSEGFVRELKSWKLIITSLVYVFVLAPVAAFVIAPSLGSSVGAGFVISNVVPASSASLGYVLIAGGSIELATALAIMSLIIAVPAIPIILGLYSSHTSIAIPVGPVMLSILYILILPLIVGQITRYLLIKWKNETVVENGSKKYLSLITMLSMLALIFVLVDKEAALIISTPQLVGYLIGYQSAIIVGVLALSIIVSRLMRITYEKHQAVAFISVTKNQSVAAAIAIFALNSEAALAPAVIPMIQPILAVVYIHLESVVKRILTPITSKQQ